MIFSYVIYAPNIHQGGGKTLLLSILEVLKDRSDILLILDDRLQLDELKLVCSVIRVKPNILHRFFLECRLKFIVSNNAKLLSLANLPTLFSSQAVEYVFIQNRYLVDPSPCLRKFAGRIRLRLIIERYWLKIRASKVSSFIVQNEVMRTLVKISLNSDSQVIPFIPSNGIYTKQSKLNRQTQYDFVYVASGEPHKNHISLINAWIILAEKGVYPSLALTLDETDYKELCTLINRAVDEYSLKIVNFGNLSSSNIRTLYDVSRALVYPSLYESFGLPLIEAVNHGLPVLAGNSDYILEVIKPTSLFDATNPTSIANAVISFSFEKASLKATLFTASEFLHKTIFQGEV